MLQPNIARQERHPGDLPLSRVQALAGALGCDLQKVVEAIAVSNGDKPPAKETESNTLMNAFWQAHLARNAHAVQLDASEQVDSTSISIEQE